LLEQFHECIPHAIFESRLLDQFFVAERFNHLWFMERWQIRRHYGADRFWQSYLAYRSKNEHDPKVGRFVELRQLAEALCRRHTGAEYEATLDTLCWLALERGAYGMPGDYQAWKTSERKNEAPNPGLNLLSAAAYLGYALLVNELLSEGYCPTQHNDLFPSPMELAAWAGNADILKLFQEHLPEFENIEPRFKNGIDWRGKAGPGAVKGAALRGDVAMVRLAMQPFSRDHVAGELTGRAKKENEELRSALYFAKTPDAFEQIRASVRPEFRIDAATPTASLLAEHAELGNVEMVRYLLDSGAQARMKDHNRNPLQLAARHWHEDIVDLLLERGADVNCMIGQQAGLPLWAAAAGGSMSIVRKLLNAGAKIDAGFKGPIQRAVILEHTAMVELLLDHYVGHVPYSTYQRIAKEEGLESMVQLLERRAEGTRLDV
jgi:ankyrin repeat protein